MSVDLNTFLRKALASKDKVDIGQFKLLNMDTVKARAGDNWPELRRKVYNAGLHFVEKRLSGDDALMPCEEGFLIIFSEPPDDPVAFISQLVSDLEDFFLGSPELTGIEISGNAASVTATELATLAKPEPPQPEVQNATAAATRTEKDNQPARPTIEMPDLPPPHPIVRGFFRPVWDADRQTVTSNICFGKCEVEGRFLDGRRVIETRMADIDQNDVDQASVRTALEVFIAFYRRKKTVKQIVAVDYATLAEPGALETYFEPFATLPAQLRKAFMFKIEDPPFPDPAVAEIARKLRSMGVMVILEVPFGTEELDLFAQSGVTVFSCRPPKANNAESEGLLDHDCRILNTLTKQARANKALTMLEDVRDLKTLKDAMASGVRFFSGTSVVPDSAKPVQEKPLSMVDIYRINKAA